MADLKVVDFLDVRDGQIPEGENGIGAGIAQQQYQCPADQYWLIDAIMIRTTSVAASTLFVYSGGPGSPGAGGIPIPVDEDLIDGSSNGDLDTSDRSSPIRVLPGNYLTFRWTGLTVGSICKLHFQGRILKLVR